MWCRTPGASRRACLGMEYHCHKVQHFVNLFSYQRPPYCALSLETAAAACHEINQPLQYIFLLLDEILEKDPKNETLKEIKRQYDRIRGITNKFENITVYETTDYIKGEKSSISTRHERAHRESGKDNPSRRFCKLEVKRFTTSIFYDLSTSKGTLKN